MTFLAHNKPQNSHQTLGEFQSVNSINTNQRIPCSQITHTGLTVNSNGQLVLQSGYTHILTGSPYFEATRNTGNYTIVSRWYDVTNSQYIGVGFRVGLDNSLNQNLKRGSAARCLLVPTSNTTIEMRIVNITFGSGVVNANNYTISMNHHSSNYPKAYGSGWYSVISF